MDKVIKAEKQNQTITVAEGIYLLYFVVMFGARAIGLYEGMMAYNISLVIGMLLFALKVAMTEHSLLEYAVIGGLCLLSLVVYVNTGEKGLLLYFTMMLGMKGVSVKRVFQTGAIVLGISFTMLVFLTLTGLRQEIMFTQYRTGLGVVFRHSLGYPYPNTLHTTYVVLAVLIMYLVGKADKQKLVKISLVLFGISCYLYLYSGSNTGLLITFAYLVANYYFQMRKEVSKAEGILVQLIYPFCLLFSVAGPVIVKGKLFELIDDLLHTRWTISNYFLTTEAVTFFGTRLNPNVDAQYMIDSAFLYSFLQIGIVSCMVLTILYMLMIHDCVKKQKRAELAIIVCFCVMGISDPFLFNLSYKNLMFLFVGEYLYRILKNSENSPLRLVNYKIRLIKSGKKELKISNPTTDFVIAKKDKIMELCWKRCYVYCVIFLLAAGVTTVIYFAVTKEAEVMYVDEAVYQKTAARSRKDEATWKEPIYLSQQEVDEIRDDGGIVRRYREGEPMYLMDNYDTIPKMEYFRYAISTGVLAGILLIIVLLAIELKRGVVLNENINGE